MLPVKENHKQSHSNIMCHYCATRAEPLEHIIQTCPATTEITQGNLEYEHIFKEENIEKSQNIADTMHKIIENIETS